MDIASFLLMFVRTYPNLISFAAGFLNEELLLFTAILSGRNLVSIYSVLIFGILGLLSIDSVYFFIGKSKLMDYLIKYFKLGDTLKSIPGSKSKLYLFLSKFLYGTRIATIFYWAIHRRSYREFIFYDLFAVFLWVLIMIPAGFLSGRGFHRLLILTKGIERIFAAILLTIVLIFIANKLAKKIFNKEVKENK